MIDKASHLTLVVVKFCSHDNFKLVKEQFIFAKAANHKLGLL